MNLLRFFAIISMLVYVNCILIDCKFGDEIIHNWGVRYSCKVKKFDAKEDNKIVHGIAGSHYNESLSNENITQFLAKGLKVEHVNMMP
jgi:hypothetical protein